MIEKTIFQKPGLLFAKDPNQEPQLDLNKLGTRLIQQINQYPTGRKSLQTDRDHLGVLTGIDAKKIEEVGWGIILAKNLSPEIIEKLNPLLGKRGQQAGSLFKKFYGNDGPEQGESKSRFLARHGVGPGPPQPEKVPYYLLLVGGPEDISFEFQFQLSIQYAVGRIHFDQLEEYAAYAQKILNREKNQSTRWGTGFFAPGQESDKLTKLAAEKLITPVRDTISTRFPNTQILYSEGSQADSTTLETWFKNQDGPAFIMSAGHSIIHPGIQPQDRPLQGALVCGNYDHSMQSLTGLFNGTDTVCEKDPGGLVYFQFSCFSGGTPDRDMFDPNFNVAKPTVKPFISKLCKNLSITKGGAAAVIGHVDQAWPHAFFLPEIGSFTETYKQTVCRILLGFPLGHAVKPLAFKAAELNASFQEAVDTLLFGGRVDPARFAALNLLRQDSRSYVLFGDPAITVPIMDENRREE